MHALDRAEHEQLLRVHVLPYFEQKRLTEITRELVKKFVAEKEQEFHAELAKQTSAAK